MPVADSLQQVGISEDALPLEGAIYWLAVGSGTRINAAAI